MLDDLTERFTSLTLKICLQNIVKVLRLKIFLIKNDKLVFRFKLNSSACVWTLDCIKVWLGKLCVICKVVTVAVGGDLWNLKHLNTASV